jgi:AcrR family transcriptional regulator
MLYVQPDNHAAVPDRTFIEAARREQLVVAAIETIAAEGFLAASFVRIAGKASVSPGLITYHFTNKDELIKQVLVYIGARMDTAMSGGPKAASSYVDGLCRIVEGYVRHCSRHPSEMTAIREISIASTSAAVRRLVSEREQAGTAQLAAFLAEGQQQGQFRPFDAAVFTAALYAALQAVPRQLQGLPPEQHEAYADELAMLFAHAAAKPGTPALRRLNRSRRSGGTPAAPVG